MKNDYITPFILTPMSLNPWDKLNVILIWDSCQHAILTVVITSWEFGTELQRAIRYTFTA